MKISDIFIKATDSLCDFDNPVPAPCFRKEFELDFIPESACVTICGLGFYLLYINGSDITKGALAPYISNPDDVCRYDAYDITKLLKKGRNVIGCILGNGMRNCFGGYIWDFDKADCRGPLCLALCLEASGSSSHFSLECDESVKVHPSHITFNDLRMGFHCNSNLEPTGWLSAGFDDSRWKNARLVAAPKGVKKFCEAEPISVREVLFPVSVKHYDTMAFAYEDTSPNAAPLNSCIRNNIYLFDFGKNTAGVTKLSINGKKGQKITIRHGEMLQNSRFSISNIIVRDPENVLPYLEFFQKDEFICKGGYEEFTPVFKYDGFRYAYVEGLEKEQLTGDLLTYLVMSSDIERRADFECSDKTLNALYSCTVNSDLSNFYYFPTDCPHREKNGWTGDASISAEQLLLNLKSEKSLREWLTDIRLSQKDSGELPGIVPTGGWGFDWGNGPLWDEVCVNLPYYIYKFTGDKSIIAENAEVIHKYLKYAYSKRDENGLYAYGLGDWSAPSMSYTSEIDSPLIVTDSITVCSMSAKAKKLFEIAGLKQEYEFAAFMAESTRAAIRSHLIDFSTYNVSGGTQTCQAYAIAADIFNEDEKPRAFSRLIDIIHRDGDINTCGIVGLRYIYHLLFDMGEGELAYKMIASQNRNCCGSLVKNNATSLPENFKTPDCRHIDSYNHHFFGDISNVLISKVAGICVNPSMNNHRGFLIKPCILNDIEYADASYMTENGALSVHWEKTEGGARLAINVPPKASAEFITPGGFKCITPSRLVTGENTIIIKKSYSR